MPIKRLLFASSNQGKIEEVTKLLSQMVPDVQVFTLHDFPGLEKEVDETGETLEANALLKAQAYLDNPEKLPVLTDDTGLDVAAFPGLVGIHAARWVPGGILACRDALLEKLKGVEERGLTFTTCFCLLLPNQPPLFFTGQMHGTAAHALIGETCFGYDPLFIPDGYNQTLSQLGPDVKNEISHRRRALEKLAAYLQKQNS